MTEFLAGFLLGGTAMLAALVHVIRRYQHSDGKYGEMVRWLLFR